MHVGWTTLGAIALASCLPWRRIGYVVAALLIATGNHYWLDAVAGWFVIAVSALINRLLPYPLPINWPWVHQPTSQSQTPLATGSPHEA